MKLRIRSEMVRQLVNYEIYRFLGCWVKIYIQDWEVNLRRVQEIAFPVLTVLLTDIIFMAGD